MSSIRFHGACGTVTGSANELIDPGGYRLMVDCGMFQGPAEVEAYNQKPLEISDNGLQAVLLTHAHLDHCGRLPLLIKNGFVGPIFMTEPTRDLVELALYDAAHIQEKEGEKPLYGEDEVGAVMRQVRVIGYNKMLNLGPYQIKYVDAGHILGAASIIINPERTGQRICFSGDLGNSPQDIVRETEPVTNARTVVMESTYGDAVHPEEKVKERLGKVIKQVEDNGATLLVPAFSLERTQELLHLLDHLKKEGVVSPTLPVFLDSPMAIRATQVFSRHQNYYNRELRQHAREDDPFDFPGLVLTMKNWESARIDEHSGAKMIIAGSGMMTGGRILKHAKKYLPLDATILLFVGYQGEETLGREIQEGAKTVSIDGEEVTIKAQIETISALSSHADRNQLVRWLGRIHGVKDLILTHGENHAREELAKTIHELHPHVRIHRPNHLDEIVIA